jgi:predicted peptidase
MSRSLSAVLLLTGSFISMDVRDSFAEQDFGIGEIEFTGGQYENEKFTYLILPPLKIEDGKEYPLLFFMHGAGERGNDVKKLLPHLPTQMAKEEWLEKYPLLYGDSSVS